MSKDPQRASTASILKRPWWIVVALLILLLIAFSVHNFVRGAGEASGISQAAPGDDNATPSADTVQHSQQ